VIDLGSAADRIGHLTREATLVHDARHEYSGVFLLLIAEEEADRSGDEGDG
jgi:hypothetical protein